MEKSILVTFALFGHQGGGNYCRDYPKIQKSSYIKNHSTYNIQTHVYTYVFRVTEFNEIMKNALNVVFRAITPQKRVRVTPG